MQDIKIVNRCDMHVGDVVHIVGRGDYASTAPIVLNNLFYDIENHRHFKPPYDYTKRQYIYVYLGSDYFFYPIAMTIKKMPGYVEWILLSSLKHRCDNISI